MNFSNATDKLRVAIAGLGFGKKIHLEALKESDYLIPTAIFHYKKEKGPSLEKETGLNFYHDWGELVKSKDIDGIIIATSPESRFELAKEALENNKHLLLEKPVALTSEEIKELQRISLVNNLSVCVDFEYRAVPLFLQTKKMIDENILGKIYLIKLDWLMGSRSDPNRAWNWYSLKEKGGGVVGALGTHAFDMLNWFFGESIVVSGKLSTSIKKRSLPNSSKFLKVTSEDICIANLEIKTFDDIIVPCQVSLSSISKCGRGFSLEVYGSEGSLFLKSENQKDYVHGFNLKISNREDKTYNLSADPRYDFEKTWTDGRIAPVQRIQSLWAHSIKNQTPVIPGLSEGLNSQRVCEAIRKSAESGLNVRI
ncbi:putative oxidoreductase [Prochlorococcus marinus str. MIT 9515]|uniref:Putative oxidoreductase n=1 Tax=Prochlorococcus marinus (strain MIT 9515) TaxID=167542 RepID=A2BW47_PROM5|nr:Gfo/Idh/MocA family oxidoreductase [Prochlorococcus marinus]ABM72008.1 putative oxidoreductase [Prochlorococcus marinus str. MIT 9515]